MERLAKVGFVIGLVVYFIFAVVAKAPAQWGTKAAIDAVPNLSLGGVSGTLWDGAAAAATIEVQGQIIDLGGFAWHVDPWSLMSLNICADVNSALLEVNVCRSLAGDNHVKNLMVDQVPAKLLNKTIGVAKLEGYLSLTVKKAQFTDKGNIKSLDGTILWDEARGDVGGGWFDLGGFMIELTENGSGGLLGSITDTSGFFELALKAEYSLGEEPRLNGTIKPRLNAQQPIVDSLGLFTEALDDGSFKITWPM